MYTTRKRSLARLQKELQRYSAIRKKEYPKALTTATGHNHLIWRAEVRIVAMMDVLGFDIQERYKTLEQAGIILGTNEWLSLLP